MDAPRDGQSLPPAGWFTDPQNSAQERWWDGTQWTEHQRDRTVVPPPSAAPAYGAPPSAAQPAYAQQPTYVAAPPLQPYSTPRPSGLSPLGKRAAILGLVAGGLFLLGFALLIMGGSTAQLNFLLWFGLLPFVGAFICGLVAMIMAIVAASRHVH